MNLTLAKFRFYILSFQNWKKFGNSEFDAPGPNVATTTVSDDVFMTFISSKEVRICCEVYDFVLLLSDAFQATLHCNLLWLVCDNFTFSLAGFERTRPG